MKVMIASEDEQNFKEINQAVKKVLPDCYTAKQWLIDAGSWFITNEPEISIIDSSIHPDDAHDLLRLMVETNAGHNKKTIMCYKDEKLRKRCEENGYNPSVWVRLPIDGTELGNAITGKKDKKKKLN
jgi:ribonuclease BN (tRNA processing enzyme)